MIVDRRLPDGPGSGNPVVCSIGTFDGVHLGHQRIISEMRRWAGAVSGDAVVLTFERNPRANLNAGSDADVLTDLEEKLGIFNALGINRTVVLEFTREFARIGPEDFIRRHLVPSLGPAGVVLGPGHRFGSGGRGDWSLLVDLSKDLSFEVRRVSGVEFDGELISSTRVRTLVREGDLAKVRRCLGRPFTIGGRIVSGDRIGTGISYPTANIRLRDEAKILPPDGVYVVRAALDKEVRGGVMYIGKRPTFAAAKRSIEVHLFDFNERLYDREMVVFVLERLRGDRVFAGPDELKRQIGKDESAARRSLDRDAGGDEVPLEKLLG